MTIDKQLDRHPAPLAFVSDQNYPGNLDPTSDQLAGGGEQESSEENSEPSSPPTNAFEGFGSFSG